MTEMGGDAPWNSQNANPDCSADADRDAKGHSEDAKQPFLLREAELVRARSVSMRLA